jgi:hypothetical protein
MARTGRPAVVPTPRRVRWRRRRLKQARTPAGLGFVRAGRHRSPMPAGLGFVRMPAPLRFVRMARSSGSFGISRTTALHGAACCDGGSRHRSRPTQGSRASRVRSDASATRVRSVFITCSTSRLRCRCDHPAGTPAPRATGHPAGHGPRNAETPADLGFVWHFAGAGWYGLVARGKPAPGLPWRTFHSARTGRRHRQPPEASSMVGSGLVP